MSDAVLLEAPISGPAAWSGFYNNRFEHWPQGDTVTVPAGRDLYVCGGWRVVNSHGAGDVTASKAGPQGGIRLTGTFSGPDQYVYLRQLCPGLMRFSGATFTPTFEVDLAQPTALDFYGQARYSTSDAERLLLIDTNQDLSVFDAGTRFPSASFTVPRLSLASPWPMTDRACAELALRIVSTGPGPFDVVVRGASLAEGEWPRYPALTSPQDELRAVEAFEECGSFRITGLAAIEGQKSIWVPWRTKAMPVVKEQIRFADRLGTPGCVTGYTRAGVAVDGIVPTIGASAKYGYQSGCSVILPNDSPLVGISGSFRVIAY